MGFNDRQYSRNNPYQQRPSFSFGPSLDKSSFTFKLLIINIIVFFVDNLFLRDPHTKIGLLENIGHFSAQTAILDFQIWRFFTFQFLHADAGHLLGNMIALYFFGYMVEQYFGSKRFLAFYLLSGAAGALAYIVLWQFGFYGASVVTPLVGASAGIYAILIAGAKIAPNTKVLLMMIIPVSLKTLAWGLIAYNTFNVLTEGSNAGGQAGHLGGAALGYFLLTKPHLLNFADRLSSPIPTSSPKTKNNKKYKKKFDKEIQKRRDQQDIVNKILDKVKAQGLQSLSEKEKKLLQKETDRQKNAS